jgi:hypothetical protein
MTYIQSVNFSGLLFSYYAWFTLYICL